MNAAFKTLFVIGLLVFGCMNTLATKFTFQMKSVDLTGHLATFQKPWFGVLRMFQAMSFVLIIHLISELRNHLAWRSRSKHDGYNALEEKPAGTPWKAYFYVAVPAALDLLGTTATYVGLFYIAPSIWQMFRGAMIIWATFFSVVVLGRKMSKVRWLGVAMCVGAICIVGIANVESKQPEIAHVTPEQKVFGMLMIMLGQVVQGGQIVVEEYLMKGVSCPPLMIVGMEGVWGVVMCFAIIFPVVGSVPGSDVGGVMENLQNDEAMLKNSTQLQTVIIVYLVSCFTYNIAGMMVTYSLSAIHRTMLEASRTAIIWGLDLAIHYFHPSSPYGEVWTAWSFLQLAGFVLLVTGQATYSEILTWGLAPKVIQPSDAILSPMKSPHSPARSRGSSFASPKAMLDLSVDMPEEGEGEFEVTGLEQK